MGKGKRLTNLGRDGQPIARVRFPVNTKREREPKLGPGGFEVGTDPRISHPGKGVNRTVKLDLSKQGNQEGPAAKAARAAEARAAQAIEEATRVREEREARGGHPER